MKEEIDLNQIADKLHGRILFPKQLERVKNYLNSMKSQENFDKWIDNLMDHIKVNYPLEFESKKNDINNFKILMREYFINDYTIQAAYEEERSY